MGDKHEKCMYIKFTENLLVPTYIRNIILLYVRAQFSLNVNISLNYYIYSFFFHIYFLHAVNISMKGYTMEHFTRVIT